VFNRKLKEIPETVFLGQTGNFFDMVSGDKSDYIIPVKKGGLSLDANLYGALYYLLHKE
jgi:hypothetical protein